MHGVTMKIKKPLDIIAGSLSNIALDGAFCKVAFCVGTLQSVLFDVIDIFVNR